MEDQENLEMFQQFRKSEQTEKEARLKVRQCALSVHQMGHTGSGRQIGIPSLNVPIA